MITYQIFKIYYWKNKTKQMMMMTQLRINIINLFIKKENQKLKKTKKNKIKNWNIAIYNNPLPKNLLQYSIELLICGYQQHRTNLLFGNNQN